MSSAKEEVDPHIGQIITFQPETFPLHRWDASSPPAVTRPKLKFGRWDAKSPPQPPRHQVRTKSLKNMAAADLPELPFGEDENNENHNDNRPKRPNRRGSAARPSFLASQSVGPALSPKRRLPPRSKGYNRNCALKDIPLRPILFDGNALKDDTGVVPLQEVITGVRNTVSSSSSTTQKHQNNNSVTVVFAIRRPGCGQCREHGMHLAELVQKNNNNSTNTTKVHLMGVLKETAGLHKSIYEFYSDYFSFHLYQENDPKHWQLFHTIGNQKLNVFSYLASCPANNWGFHKRGIRNIPLGGDHLTQGGVLIFDGQGQLRFVYYETYGHQLDMEAIQWAIDQANNNEVAENEKEEEKGGNETNANEEAPIDAKDKEVATLVNSAGSKVEQVHSTLSIGQIN